MELLVDVFEMYTCYNEERGDWSNVSCHTKGTWGITSGHMTLAGMNKAIENVGHPPLTKETLEKGVWSADYEAGRFDYNVIGTSDGCPDPDGKYLYDISLWLSKIDPQPVSKDELIAAL